MPRRVPSYRRHSGGQARVTVRGKDYMLPYGSDESKENYARLIAEYLASGPESFGKRPAVLLIADVVLDYMSHCKSYYKGSTEPANIKLAMRPVLRLYESLPAKDFGPGQFKAVRQEWLQTGKRSRQYINKQMGRVLRLIKWAVSENKMPAELYQSCKCVEPLKAGRCDAVEAEPVKPVSAADVEKRSCRSAQLCSQT